MWFTPAATASRRTAIAASGSLGGPHTPGPASCIAPYPIRLTVNDVPGKVNRPPRVDLFIVSSIAASIRAKTVLRTTSEHECLNRMWQAADLRGVAVQPEKIGNLLIGLVHYHHRHFSIRIHKGGGKQGTSARCAGDFPCARADKL